MSGIRKKIFADLLVSLNFRQSGLNFSQEGLNYQQFDLNFRQDGFDCRQVSISSRSEGFKVALKAWCRVSEPARFGLTLALVILSEAGLLPLNFKNRLRGQGLLKKGSSSKD